MKQIADILVGITYTAWSENEALSIMREQRPNWKGLQVKRIITQTH